MHAWRNFSYFCLMKNIEKVVKTILGKAIEQKVGFWSVCDNILTPQEKYYLWSKIKENDELSNQIEQHHRYLSDEQKSVADKNLSQIAENISNVVQEKKVQLKSVKKKYRYIYPTDAEGNIVYDKKLAKKVIIDEVVEKKERYIKPDTAVVIHALNHIQNTQNNYSVGLITNIVNAVKSLHLNEISEATFVSILSAMPLPDEIKKQIIAENTQKSEGSVFDVVAWGEKEISQKLQKDKDIV